MSPMLLRNAGIYLVAGALGGGLFWLAFHSLRIEITSAAVHDFAVYLVLAFVEARHDKAERKALNDRNNQ